MISRALLNAPFFIPKDADLLRNRKVNTKKRQNRHLPELAFLILGTYFTAPISLFLQPLAAHTSSLADQTPDISSLFSFFCASSPLNRSSYCFNISDSGNAFLPSSNVAFACSFLSNSSSSRIFCE